MSNVEAHGPPPLLEASWHHRFWYAEECPLFRQYGVKVRRREEEAGTPR